MKCDKLIIAFVHGLSSSMQGGNIIKKREKLQLVVIFTLIISLALVVYNKNNTAKSVTSQLAFQFVAKNIVQLEGAIMYQIENDWTDPSYVLEKIEDIKLGIHVTHDMAKRLQSVSNEHHDILSRLAFYFDQFPSYSGFPGQSIEEMNSKEFEVLREYLGTVGWGFGLNYNSSWEDFIKRAEDLLYLNHFHTAE